MPAERRPGVLVTGGAGYVGSHVLLALLERGRPVVVIDDLSTGAREAVPAGVPFHRGSIHDEELVARLIDEYGVGAVVHLAASVCAPESMADPLKYYRNNTCGSLALATTCVAGGVERFIFSSSAAVYGAVGTSPIGEDAEPRPISPYGSSKLMTEVMLADLAVAYPKFRVLTFRYFNVGGADPEGRAGPRSPDASGLIAMAMKTAFGDSRELEIRGDDYPTRDGTAERDFIHVSDLAEAHAEALDYLDAGGAAITLNCGRGRGHTVLEVVAALEGILGRALPGRRSARRPGDPAAAISDSTRLIATLGWRPRFDSLDFILETELAWEFRRRTEQFQRS